ncbi:protein-glutamate O-methyltransferase CheR [bacterium]|nr:MAG: protein-glutamate O-methyltransferase CheR [bacterium]
MTPTFTDISDEYIKKFINMLSKQYDVDFSGYNVSFLRRRIASRMNRTSIYSVDKYYEHLQNSPHELSMLLQNLTINISEFMRNPDVFDIIATRIIPEIIANSKNNQIRFWTAGCSKGEEPYSLAIILSKLGFNKNQRAIIIATDIDDIALQEARQGIYKESSLKNLSPRDKKIYFHNSDGKYRVKSFLKKMVIFKKHNILTGLDLGKFNVIICRNVSIYFGKQLQHKMYKRFADDLYHGGYLIIGKSEIIPREFDDVLKSVDLEHRIYRKV